VGLFALQGQRDKPIRVKFGVVDYIKSLLLYAYVKFTHDRGQRVGTESLKAQNLIKSAFFPSRGESV